MSTHTHLCMVSRGSLECIVETNLLLECHAMYRISVKLTFFAFVLYFKVEHNCEKC